MKMMLFKVLTAVAGFYHILIGISGLILPQELFMKIASLVLGIHSEMEISLQMAAKFASVYVLVFGIMLLIWMKHPQKYRILAIPVLTLFGLRLINKIVFFESIAESFNTPVAQNYFAVGSIALFFFGILLTLPKKEEN